MKGHDSNCRALNLALGKVLIAAAWADGELDEHELEFLKHLVMQLPEVSFEDWRKLKAYLAYPVTSSERDGFVKEFVELALSRGRSEIAWSCLHRVLRAHGLDEPEAEEFHEDMNQAAMGSTSVFLEKLDFYVSQARMEARSGWNDSWSGREGFIHEFFDNPVYFVFRKTLLKEDLAVAGSKLELQKICLFASILSWFAKLDGHLSMDESEFIIHCLVQKCKLEPRVASCMLRVASSVALSEVQLSNLCSSFAEEAEIQEREEVFSIISNLVILDRVLSSAELEGLRTLALYMKIRREVWFSTMKSLSENASVFEE